MSDDRTNPKDIAGRDRAPMHLFPETAVLAGSMAFLEGAWKYGPYNWREKHVSASVYHGAAKRHMAAWYARDETDPDSGLSHLWKALACIAILIDAEECGAMVDDRPPPAPVERMLERAKEQARAIRERLPEGAV